MGLTASRLDKCCRAGDSDHKKLSHDKDWYKRIKIHTGTNNRYCPMFGASISTEMPFWRKKLRDHSQGTQRSLSMIRDWQRLNERETREGIHDINASEILTRCQIGLNGQSHYVHKDVIFQECVLSPDPSQLYQRRKSASNDPAKQAYIINHCRCNEQVRERVCGEPGLVGHSNSVSRELIHFVCQMTLLFGMLSEAIQKAILLL